MALRGDGRMSRRRPGSKYYDALPKKRWARFRRALLNSRCWRCERCGRAGKLEVHHRRPLHEGGAAFDPENCEILCRICHVSHHKPELAPEVEEWQAFIKELVD